jgi:hypothetical protein
MADWSTIASFATAGGTLVLAAATFSAVRSSNQSARVAERSLLAGLRPVLVPSRRQDPTEKVLFVDLKWLYVAGGQATLDVADDSVIAMTMGIRNVGTGLAVLRAWRVEPGFVRSADSSDPSPLDSFRRQTRDIYVPAGDSSFWQGAIREPDDPDRDGILAAITNREGLTIELLYGDGEGGQRVVSRFAIVPAGDDAWLVSVSRHWNLDRDDPR